MLAGAAQGVAERRERVLARPRQRDGVAKDRLRIMMRPFHDMNQTEHAIGLFGRRRHRQRARDLLARAVVAPRVEIHVTETPPRRDRRRVELLRGVRLDQRLLHVPAGREQRRVPLVRRRIARVEGDGAPEFTRGVGVLPLIDKEHPP